MSRKEDPTAIFCKALEIPDSEDREDFLTEACRSDPGLRAEVDSLLGAHFEAETKFMDQAAGNRWEENEASVPSAETLAADFPDLEILELLGRGGMGAVFKARQASLDRLVALKVLPDAWSSSDSFRERFEREAKTLASLNHPNIVTIHDFGERNGRFFFTMEYVDGTDLAHMIRGQELEPELALELIPQICTAMQYAHDHHVVHRDIKPGNILVGRDGRVKVADFGLAKLGTNLAETPTDDGVPDPRASDPQLTDPRGVMGTPLYMAPEQAAAGSSIDHRADLYALGVVFYEMLVGAPPADGELVIPPSHKGKVDRRWDRVILRALERDPDRRYQNATEIRTAVETVLAERRWIPRWAKTAAVAVLAAGIATAVHLSTRGGAGADEALTNSLGMRFVPVAGVDGLVSIWETRVRDYAAFVEETGRGWPKPPFEQTAEHPVVRVSWHDARAFCQWLTEREHASGELPPGEVYRLPTDREWSAMAALGEEEGATPAERHHGQKTIYPWGEEGPVPEGAGNYPDAEARTQMVSAAITGYRDGFAATAPVGQFEATPDGLLDLGGNAWEWTSTAFASDDARPVLRGGGWWALKPEDGWSSLLASHRRADVEADENDHWDVGFRLVRGPAPSETEETDLFHLVLQGDLESVRSALDGGAEADDSNPAGQPLIVVAADAGDLAMVQLLHQHGAKLSSSDRRGRTPLHAAAELGHTDMARWLLQQGADPRAKTIRRAEPFHLAMERAPTELLDTLFEAASPECLVQADAGGSFPITYAFVGDAPDANVAWLIEHIDESQLRELDAMVRSEWLCQLMVRNEDLLQALLMKLSASLDDVNLPVPIMLAIALGREAHFSILMAARGDKELPESALAPLGHYASGAGRPWALKQILALGWNPDISSRMNDASVLHAAARSGKASLRDGLMTQLDSGAGEDANKVWFSRMVLGVLVKMDPPETRETIRILVEAGADLDVRDDRETTPLCAAAMNGNLAAVETLVALGADIEAKDELGFTPLLSAVEKGALDIVKELERNGADFGATTEAGSGPLHLALRNPAMLSYLLTKKLPLELRDSRGRTPLFVSGDYALPDSSRLLLEAGAEVDAAAGGEYSGSTPLIIACGLPDPDEMKRHHETRESLGETKTKFMLPGSREDRIRFIKVLLEHGANPTVTNAKDWTPLHVASKYGFYEALDLLLERPGVNVNAITKELRPPLHLAVAGGHLESARLLIDHGAILESPIFPTPLINNAVQSGNSELLEYLIAKDLPIDRHDSYGALPIHHAGYRGDTSMIRILTEAGADIGSTDRFYQTPLHMAAMAGHRKAVDLLIELGANPKARDLTSRTPAQAAAESGHSALASRLRSLEKD